MGLDRVNSGRALPDEFNVIIEIPMNADPIKYEVDHDSGALFVDRFMSTAMHYPCNYGYIPNTLADDDMCMATPALAGDRLLIRTATRLYALRSTP
jgi:inorganic pyrophosphatase